MTKIAYKTHRFNESSAEIVLHANVLIEDYAQQGLSLTLRQLYYRFVAADLFANNQRNYARLGSIISNARLAGLLDWEAIEDRGRQLMGASHWDSPQDILRAAARGYAIDKWQGQEYRVEVWVEKQALEGVVGQAAKPYDCSYFSCKGYTSQSEMWRAAMRLQEFVEAGQHPVIIHLGDHDPSGIDMTRDIVERLSETFGVDVTVARIALNMDQVEEHRPPPNPAKLTDSRAGGYIRKFGRSSWELDALEPATLRELIQTHICEYLDQEKFERMQEQENAERGVIDVIADRLDAAVGKEMEDQ